jgi:ascorbate-specific PTS system EIIC-type component UlaA
LAQVVAGCLVTGATAFVTSAIIGQYLGGRGGATVALLCASVVGFLSFVAVQMLCRSQEARWLLAGVTHRASRTVADDKINT